MLVVAAALVGIGVLLVVAVRWRPHAILPIVSALVVGGAAIGDAGHTEAATSCPRRRRLHRRHPPRRVRRRPPRPRRPFRRRPLPRLRRPRPRLRRLLRPRLLRRQRHDHGGAGDRARRRQRHSDRSRWGTPRRQPVRQRPVGSAARNARNGHVCRAIERHELQLRHRCGDFHRISTRYVRRDLPDRKLGRAEHRPVRPIRLPPSNPQHSSSLVPARRARLTGSLDGRYRSCRVTQASSRSHRHGASDRRVSESCVVVQRGDRGSARSAVPRR